MLAKSLSGPIKNKIINKKIEKISPVLAITD
jgi:hypothetical protein